MMTARGGTSMAEQPDHKTDVGVVIGRFQVDELHEGHLALIEAAKARHPHLLILLGCRTVGVPPDANDPLDYKSRQAMMAKYFPDAIILPIHDRRTDEDWSKDVDAAIGTAYPAERATIYGGRASSLDSYRGRHEKRALDLGQDVWSGTQSRRRIYERPPLEDATFRAGVIWALASARTRQDLAVDIAMTRARSHAKDGRLDLALVRRNADHGFWRFPGGFVEPSDASMAQAARRELAEETGLGCESAPRFVSDRVIDDWRVRGSNAIIRSSLWHAWHSWGSIEAQSDFDDADGAEWAILDLVEPESLRSRIVEEHRPFFDDLVAYLRADQGWDADRLLFYKSDRAALKCPKCGARTGDDWTQCGGSCPMPQSPYYDVSKEAV
jgi:bifunctional NMN adenylyltransferase/nudix hydrolase